jgi:hypothetical protein
LRICFTRSSQLGQHLLHSGIWHRISIHNKFRIASGFNPAMMASTRSGGGVQLRSTLVGLQVRSYRRVVITLLVVVCTTVDVHCTTADAPGPVSQAPSPLAEQKPNFFSFDAGEGTH